MINNLDIAFVCDLAHFKDMGTRPFRFGHINAFYKVSVYNLNAAFHDKYNSKKTDTSRLTSICRCEI